MIRIFRKSIVAAGLAALGFGLFTPLSATANYTVIQPTTPGQKNQQQILEHIYGAGFAPSGVDFVNAGLSITATRVSDDPQAGNLNPTSASLAGKTDQVWGPGIVSVSAKARFAAYGQRFGYVLTGQPISLLNRVNYVELFNTTGSAFSVTGSASDVNLSGDTWRWVRWSGTTTPPDGLLQTSLESDNIDKGVYTDHMVTYLITGLNTSKTERTWLLFWEDLNIGDPKSAPASDRDFNDLVVEVTARYVPTPTAALSGLGMLVGMGALSARRRFRSSI